MKPLEGISVLEFAHVFAGPLASYFLCLQGASVTKIESTGGGDNLRQYGPDRRYDGMSPAFISVNAGKRSIALDLKKPEGRDVALALVQRADVVIENFRPGVIDRLGFGYERCRELKKDIVYCSISGYGQSGPWRDHAAVDNIVQGTSGMMMASGLPGAGPIRVGFPAIDSYSGTIAAYAIVGALLRRERSGEGQYLDVAMLDAALVLQTAIAVPYLVTGRLMPKSGNTGYSNLPTAGVFATRSGKPLSIGAIQQNQFEALCRGIGRPDLLDNPLFATSAARTRPENAAALRELLATLFLEKDAVEWEQLLHEAGAPAGAVRTLDEACNHPALEHRHLKLPMHIDGLPDREDVHVLNAGFLANADQPGVTLPPPRIGEHTDDVLRELGYDAAAIAALREQGTVG